MDPERQTEHGGMALCKTTSLYIHTEQVKDGLFVITSCIKSKRTRAEKKWQWGLTQEKPEVDGRVLFMKLVYTKKCSRRDTRKSYRLQSKNEEKKTGRKKKYC